MSADGPGDEIPDLRRTTQLLERSSHPARSNPLGKAHARSDRLKGLVEHAACPKATRQRRKQQLRVTLGGRSQLRLHVPAQNREQVFRDLHALLTARLHALQVFPDNPDDTEARGTSNLRASLQRVLATHAPDTMAVQKYDIRGPDGVFQAKYWSPKNIPVLGPSGELIYILHRVEDVTDLVRASELGEELRGRTRDMEVEVLVRSRELAVSNNQLRAANLKLGELDAAKTAFSNNVSHEFRTPLTLMLGPLEDSLADATEPLAPEQRPRIELSVVLVNLLGNAWKFTACTSAAHIAFARHADEPHAFVVRDNGAGFDMNRAVLLFAPFQRFHRATDFAGTGVGLATVQRVVSRHGGRIWAESVPERGAAFFFTLPP